MTIVEVISDSQLSDLRWKYKDNEEVSWIIACLTATIEEGVESNLKELRDARGEICDLKDAMVEQSDYISELKSSIDEIRKAAA